MASMASSRHVLAPHPLNRPMARPKGSTGFDVFFPFSFFSSFFLTFFSFSSQQPQQQGFQGPGGAHPSSLQGAWYSKYFDQMAPHEKKEVSGSHFANC
jgi:hypothetical protein